MRRAFLVLVPLLLALVAVSVAGATGAESVPGEEQLIVSNHGNATNYLAIASGDVQRTGHTTAGLDAGLETAVAGRDLQTEHELRSFRQRFDAAGTDENRTAAYGETITNIEDRTDELYARTDSVTAAYARGSMEARTLVRERAAISAEASRLQATVGELESVARERLSYDLPDGQTVRLRNVAGRLESLQGPVSDRTARLAAGGSTPESIYVESSASGYVFALMEGDTYVRETYLGDEYDPSASDQFVDAEGDRIEQVLERATELYPTTTSEGVSGFGTTAIYRYNAEFDGGLVSVYLDGGTTNAFREGQQAAAPTLPVSDVTETTNGTVTMRINRTFPTGPMKVELVNSATGTPVQGTVTVNGHSVGETDAEGRRWAIEPRGEVTVEARTPDATLTTSFDTS